MASIELREELNCSICLNILTDPVNLTCGHNFCRACIDSVFTKQKVTGGYSCPECRIKFKKRPGLQRNITLCNVVRHFHSAPEPEMKASGIFCTYCIHSAVAAVKSCLLCEASLYHDHLRVHNKSPEHVLSDPTACPEDRKCSIHKRILEYYCTEDSTCVCATCCLLGEHKGHHLESLKEISEKKKEKLKADLEELTTETRDIERKVQILKEYQIKETERAADLTKRVSTILLDLKRQMEVQLTKVLRDVNYKEDCISYSVSGILDQLEAKRASLACKMSQISELHNSSDPLAVLQYRKSSVDDSSDMKDKNEKLPGSVDEMLSGVGDMKVEWVLEELKASLANIIKGINIWIFKPEPEDLTLDVNTAANNVLISDDLRTATWSENCPNHPETPERFEKYQVLSVQSFSSGRHYWEVETLEAFRSIWRVGLCYPSMDRKDNFWIGSNKKSWCLSRLVHLAVVHDNNVEKLRFLGLSLPSKKFGIYLDYEAGQLSFYILRDSIQHLHTYTTTFTEPLHVAFYITDGYSSVTPKVGSWVKMINYRNNSQMLQNLILSS